MEAFAPNRPLAGRYVLLETIAPGGMAMVWRARDEVLARTVAVKILRDEFAENAGVSERFRREAVAAAKLTHPNIVRVFDAGEDQGRAYIVMEHFEGRTLAALLEEHRVLAASRAVQLMVPVLAGLGYAHAHGVIHRDVKPGNILVGRDDRVMLTDFGIARAAYADGSHQLTTTNAMLGTVRYLSPEQVQGTETDARSDLYSVGVTLYETLTGRAPFAAQTEIATAIMRLTSDPLPLRAIRPEIPRDLETIVLRAMARRPEDRHPSAEALQADLQRLAAGRSRAPSMPIVRRTPARERAPRGGSSFFRAWMLVPLLLLLVAAAAIGVGLAIGRLEIGGAFGIQAAPPASPETSARLLPIDISGVEDFDPLGDGDENEDEVPLAFDGDPATWWSTEHYDTSAFGNLKAGLGLFVDLGGVAVVDRVTIVSPLSGWRFELRAGGSPTAATTPIQSSAGRRAFEVGSAGRVAVDLPSVQAGGLLIWITKLAPDEGRFAASIAEVRVSGAGA